MIALQCCVGFCLQQCESAIRILRSLALEPPCHLHASKLSQSPSLSSLYHTEDFHRPPVLPMVMYMAQRYSQFIPPSPSCCVHEFFMSVLLFLPYKWVHQYHFSRFHIYALIYDVWFSLCDLLLSVNRL